MDDNPSSQHKDLGAVKAENPEENENSILFFNYHEFVATDSDGGSQLRAGVSPVVNHFPNNHSALGSSTYENTRIVRIPRIYSTIELSDIIPQFSTYPLGKEPNAIINPTNIDTYKIKGTVDGNYFGDSSLTPLVPDLIASDDLSSIISTVNQYLFDAFNPFSFWNCLDNILEMVSGTLYSKVVNNFIFDTHCKRKLMELERYIEDLNKKHEKQEGQGFKIVSPRRCAYLSLDVVIPRPVPKEGESSDV